VDGRVGPGRLSRGDARVEIGRALRAAAARFEDAFGGRVDGRHVVAAEAHVELHPVGPEGERPLEGFDGVLAPGAKASSMGEHPDGSPPNRPQPPPATLGQKERRERVQMRIDVHAHYLPAEYVERLARAGRGQAANDPAPKQQGSLQQRIEWLDQAGQPMVE